MTEPTYMNITPEGWTLVAPQPQYNQNNIPLRGANGEFIPSFTLPECIVPFGIQEPLGAKDGEASLDASSSANKRKNMSLTISDPAFLEWLAKVDSFLVKLIVANCRLIFKRDISEMAIKEVMYQNLVRPSKKEGYAPTVRVKIATTGEDPRRLTKILVNIPGTKDFYQGTEADVTNKSQVIVHVKLNSLWTTQTSVGALLVASHMLVYAAGESNKDPFQVSTVPRPAESYVNSVAAPGSTSGAAHGATPGAAHGAATSASSVSAPSAATSSSPGHYSQQSQYGGDVYSGY